MSERNGNVLMHNSAQTKEDVADSWTKIYVFFSPMCITIFDLTRRRKKERQTNTAIAKNGKRVREKQYVNMSLKIIAIILICIRSIATSRDVSKNTYLPVFAKYFALDDKRINGYHNTTNELK